MTTPNESKPANPCTETPDDRELVYLGLTKLEHFTAMAMQALANASAMRPPLPPPELIAGAAVALARATLQELDKAKE